MHHVVIMLYLRIHGWGDYSIQDAIPTDHGQDHGYHDPGVMDTTMPIPPGWYHGNDHNTLRIRMECIMLNTTYYG